MFGARLACFRALAQGLRLPTLGETAPGAACVLPCGPAPYCPQPPWWGWGRGAGRWLVLQQVSITAGAGVRAQGGQ